MTDNELYSVVVITETKDRFALDLFFSPRLIKSTNFLSFVFTGTLGLHVRATPESINCCTKDMLHDLTKVHLVTFVLGFLFNLMCLNMKTGS